MQRLVFVLKRLVLWQVKRLVEMGFGDAQVRSAIESSGGDENVALEKLCSGQNPSNQASFGA